MPPECDPEEMRLCLQKLLDPQTDEAVRHQLAVCLSESLPLQPGFFQAVGRVLDTCGDDARIAVASLSLLRQLTAGAAECKRLGENSILVLSSLVRLHFATAAAEVWGLCPQIVFRVVSLPGMSWPLCIYTVAAHLGGRIRRALADASALAQAPDSVDGALLDALREGPAPAAARGDGPDPGPGPGAGPGAGASAGDEPETLLRFLVLLQAVFEAYSGSTLYKPLQLSFSDARKLQHFLALLFFDTCAADKRLASLALRALAGLSTCCTRVDCAPLCPVVFVAVVLMREFLRGFFADAPEYEIVQAMLAGYSARDLEHCLRHGHAAVERNDAPGGALDGATRAAAEIIRARGIAPGRLLCPDSLEGLALFCDGAWGLFSTLIKVSAPFHAAFLKPIAALSLQCIRGSVAGRGLWAVLASIRELDARSGAADASAEDVLAPLCRVLLASRTVPHFYKASQTPFSACTALFADVPGRPLDGYPARLPFPAGRGCRGGSEVRTPAAQTAIHALLYTPLALLTEVSDLPSMQRGTLAIDSLYESREIHGMVTLLCVDGCGTETPDCLRWAVRGVDGAVADITAGCPEPVADFLCSIVFNYQDIFLESILRGTADAFARFSRAFASLDGSALPAVTADLVPSFLAVDSILLVLGRVWPHLTVDDPALPGAADRPGAESVVGAAGLDALFTDSHVHVVLDFLFKSCAAVSSEYVAAQARLDAADAGTDAGAAGAGADADAGLATLCTVYRLFLRRALLFLGRARETLPAVFFGPAVRLLLYMLSPSNPSDGLRLLAVATLRLFVESTNAPDAGHARLYRPEDNALLPAVADACVGLLESSLEGVAYCAETVGEEVLRLAHAVFVLLHRNAGAVVLALDGAVGGTVSLRRLVDAVAAYLDAGAAMGECSLLLGALATAESALQLVLGYLDGAGGAMGAMGMGMGSIGSMGSMGSLGALGCADDASGADSADAAGDARRRDALQVQMQMQLQLCGDDASPALPPAASPTPQLSPRDLRQTINPSCVSTLVLKEAAVASMRPHASTLRPSSFSSGSSTPLPPPTKDGRLSLLRAVGSEQSLEGRAYESTPLLDAMRAARRALAQRPDALPAFRRHLASVFGHFIHTLLAPMLDSAFGDDILSLSTLVLRAASAAGYRPELRELFAAFVRMDEQQAPGDCAALGTLQGNIAFCLETFGDSLLAHDAAGLFGHLAALTQAERPRTGDLAGHVGCLCRRLEATRGLVHTVLHPSAGLCRTVCGMCAADRGAGTAAQAQTQAQTQAQVLALPGSQLSALVQDAATPAGERLFLLAVWCALVGRDVESLVGRMTHVLPLFTFIADCPAQTLAIAPPATHAPFYAGLVAVAAAVMTSIRFDASVSVVCHALIELCRAAQAGGADFFRAALGGGEGEGGGARRVLERFADINLGTQDPRFARVLGRLRTLLPS